MIGTSVMKKLMAYVKAVKKISHLKDLLGGTLKIDLNTWFFQR